MRTSRPVNEIAPAFVAFQAALGEKLERDSSADIEGRTHSWASLAAIFAYIRHPLTDNGLSVSQDVVNMPEHRGVSVTTRMIHTSGQWYEWGPLDVPCPPDAWSIGTATSYGQRYTLNPALGIAAGVDDDAKHITEAMRATKPVSAQAPARIARATAPQLKAIAGRVEKLGRDSTWLERWLFQGYGVRKPDALTREQASRTITALDDALSAAARTAKREAGEDSSAPDPSKEASHA
jgi:hypothetical protein